MSSGGKKHIQHVVLVSANKTMLIFKSIAVLAENNTNQNVSESLTAL